MNLKKLLASSCRQKILVALSELKKTNIMELVRAVNSTYNEVNRNVHILESENIVVSSRIRHNRIVCLNHKNAKTRKLLMALSVLDDSDDAEFLEQFYSI